MSIRTTLGGLFLFTLAAFSSMALEPVEVLIERIEGALEEDAKGDDDLTLAEVMQRYHIPGVSVAVIWDNEVHWAKGYGVADVETDAPVTPETLFQAASISKPVHAMAVLRAIQEGHFGLNDDINSILESWKLPQNEFTAIRNVTPRMLMSHTSGTDDGFGFPGYHPDKPRPSLVQILNGAEPSNVGPVLVAREPFTRYKYSGGAVVMMQLALMDALEKPYETIMQELVLGPIDMTNSTFAQPLIPELDRNAARAHSNRGKAMNTKWHIYPEQSAAGLWTTPTDLCKFALDVKRSLDGEGGVLDRERALLMVNPVGIGSYGAGFSIEKQGEGWYFSHGGSNWGFQCAMVAHREKGYGMAVMTNSSLGPRAIDALVRRVTRVYEWDMHVEPLRR